MPPGGAAGARRASRAAGLRAVDRAALSTTSSAEDEQEDDAKQHGGVHSHIAPTGKHLTSAEAAIVLLGHGGDSHLRDEDHWDRRRHPCARCLRSYEVSRRQLLDEHRALHASRMRRLLRSSTGSILQLDQSLLSPAPSHVERFRSFVRDSSEGDSFHLETWKLMQEALKVERMLEHPKKPGYNRWRCCRPKEPTDSAQLLLMSTMLTHIRLEPRPSSLTILCAKAAHWLSSPAHWLGSRARASFNRCWHRQFEYTFIVETKDGETWLRGPLRSPGMGSMGMIWPKGLVKMQSPLPLGPDGTITITVPASHVRHGLG